MTNRLRRAPLWASLCAFLCGVSGLLALTAVADEPAPTLESVIETYRADVLLESDGSVETSPLFMTQAERRLAFAHFDQLYPTATVAASGGASPYRQRPLISPPYLFLPMRPPTPWAIGCTTSS